MRKIWSDKLATCAKDNHERKSALVTAYRVMYSQINDFVPAYYLCNHWCPFWYVYWLWWIHEFMFYLILPLDEFNHVQAKKWRDDIKVCEATNLERCFVWIKALNQLWDTTLDNVTIWIVIKNGAMISWVYSWVIWLTREYGDKVLVFNGKQRSHYWGYMCKSLTLWPKLFCS